MEADMEEIEGETEKRSESKRATKQSLKRIKSMRDVYSEQGKECRLWLNQNLNPSKTVTIMTILE